MYIDAICNFRSIYVIFTETVEELAIEAVKKVLPKSNRIRLISGDKSKEIVEDDDSSDLRELLNRNRDPKKGRYVEQYFFVCVCVCMFCLDTV